MNNDRLIKTKLHGEKQKKPFLLLGGIISVGMFVVGHASDSRIFLYTGLLLMVSLFVFCSDDLLCLVLLYMPLVAILKLSPDGASLLSYISLIGIFVFIIKRRTVTIDVALLVSCVGLFILFLLKEIFQQFGITMVYIRLLLTMATTAFFVKLKLKDPKTTTEEIRRANLFLTCGVLLAAIIGYSFTKNAHILQFVTLESSYVDGEIVSRFSGVSGDSNYFASLVLFAIASNLFQFIHRPHISHVIYTTVLTSFGILSLSKMFLLLLVVTSMLFLFAWIKRRGKLNVKSLINIILIVTCVLIGGYIILNSTSVQLVLIRMRAGSNLDEFTTGRSSAWLGYINRLWNNIEYFIIGSGSNSAIVGVHNTHNTILQIWWKLGLLGILFVFVWFASIWRKCKNYKTEGTFLLLVGGMGAALALDMLFFEQLFWFFIFCVLSIQIMGCEKNTKG